MRIAVVTMHSPCYSGIAEVTLPIMKAYCNKHDNEFHQLKVEDEKWPYKKHRYFNELMDTGVEVIFYLDIDAMITNHTIKVEDFLDDEHDLFLTKDVNEINCGSLIIKNTETGRWVNNEILGLIDIYENEQNASNYLFNCNDEFKKHTKLLPHPSINSYDYTLYKELPHIRKREEGHHHKGDFILHTPALSFEKRIEVLTNIKEHIIYE